MQMRFEVRARRCNRWASPDNPKPGKGTLELFHTYATQHGVMSNYKVEDALGNVVSGMLSAKGFASVSGLAPGPAMVTFGTDQADPWAPSSFVHNAIPEPSATNGVSAHWQRSPDGCRGGGGSF